MKLSFHGYYKPTNEEFDAIWNEAIIVVDANVLLNLYTYSATTSEEVLAFFGEFDERLWIPHQAALEYHKNRYGIILKELKRYSDIAKAIETVGVALRARKQHPYITSELDTRFEGIETEIKKELKEGESKHRDLITTDSICEKITELFDGKVGLPMTEEVLGHIYKKGAVRYAGKIPPGFSDIKKPDPDRYGDLVLWYQLIEHAKTSKRPVILVTDDLKEDWWAFTGDRRIGPRPELRHEFRSKTQCDLYIYSSDAFIETAKDRGKKLSESAAEEIESASRERQLDAVEKRRLKQLSHDPLEQLHERDRILERLTRDPFEQLRERDRMLDRLAHDPLEKYNQIRDREEGCDEDEPDESQPDKEQPENDE